MRLLLTRSESIELTTTITLLTLYHLCLLLLVRLGGYILQTHRETDRFFAASGVQRQPNSGLIHFRRATFSTQLKAKVGSTLAKAAALRINLNIDGSSNR